MKYYYVILERSNQFCVLETGYSTEQIAWDVANKLGEKYPEYIKDYDILFFNTEKERVSYITESTQL
jgi:hypothetical protein